MLCRSTCKFPDITFTTANQLYLMLQTGMAVNGSLNSSNHWSTNRSDIPEFEHSPISEPPYSPTDRVHIFDNKSPLAQSDTDFDLTVNTDFCLPISAELEEISQTDIEEVLNNHRNMDVGDSTWNQIYTDNVVQNEHIPTMNGEFMFMDERRVSDLSCSHLTMDSSYQANIDAWTESTLNYTSQTCIPSVTTSQSLPTGPEPSLLDISQIKKEAPDLSEQSFSCSGAPESSDQSYCSSSGIPEVDDWGLQGSEVSYLSTDSYRDVVKNEHQTRNCCVLETPGDRKPQKRLKVTD